MGRSSADALPAPPGDAEWAPRTDVAETDDAYLIAMDLPGMTPEVVEVRLDDGVLRVSGRREVGRGYEGARFHQVERSYGRFSRSFQLRSDVDVAVIDATYDGGVLTVEVPKAEARKPRQISVRSGAPSEAARPQSAGGLERGVSGTPGGA